MLLKVALNTTSQTKPSNYYDTKGANYDLSSWKQILSLLFYLKIVIYIYLKHFKNPPQTHIFWTKLFLLKLMSVSFSLQWMFVCNETRLPQVPRKKIFWLKLDLLICSCFLLTAASKQKKIWVSAEKIISIELSVQIGNHLLNKMEYKLKT